LSLFRFYIFRYETLFGFEKHYQEETFFDPEASGGLSHLPF